MSLEEMIILAYHYVEAHNLYERKDNGKHKEKKRFSRTTDHKKEGELSEVRNSNKSENTSVNYSKTDSSTTFILRS